MVEEYAPIKCNQDDCQTEANYLCYCQTPNIYLCTNHIHNEANHRSVGLYKPISEFDREKIIELCKKCKNDCLILKTNLLKECQEYIAKITKAANDLSNNIRQVENLYDDVIAKVCQLKKIKYIGDINIIEKIISCQIGNTNLDSPFWEVPKIKLDIALTVNESQINLLKYIEEINPATILTFFKQSTKIAVNVYVDKENRVDYYFIENCPENLGYYSAFCYLPDGTLFSNGGHNGSITNFTYIINTSSKTFLKKANSSYGRYNTGTCCYNNGFVYVFCGYNTGNSPFNTVERYDVKNNTWSNLNGFPASVYYCSALAFEEGIFVTAIGISNIYKLNLQNNNYENVYNIPSSSNKFMVQAIDKLYLFDNNRLFEYSNKKWEIINSSTSVYNGFHYCSPIRNGEYIYFMLNDMYLYRFNFISKKIDKLKSLNV